MKKFFLAVFILLDLGVMTAAGFILYKRLALAPMPKMPRMAGTASSATRPAMPAPSVAASTATPVIAFGAPPASAPSTPAEPAGPAGTRKVGFTYANSHAKQVALRADFTGWKAESMHRDAKGIWTFQANLPPGEYAYIFMVDDAPKRDPNNKRTKRIGTTQVSAVIVKPGAAKPAAK